MKDDRDQDYTIKEALGKGGMGHVLLVERISDNKEFALKTLQIFLESDSHHLALVNEAKLTQGLSHPNIIQYEYFHDGSQFADLPPYIIMELAEKATLQDLINQRIKENKRFTSEELLSLFSMLIDGMEAINRKLVHRDIKPSNILLSGDMLKISDFGIAKFAGDPTRTLSFKGSGTFQFLSPEVLLNQPNTIQMDIYSMGIVFYILLTLKHPYEFDKPIENEEDWRNAHLYKVPGRPKELDLPDHILSVILKMLEKNPSRRFSSWDEIRKSIEALNTLEQSEVSPFLQNMLSKDLERATIARETAAQQEKQKSEEKQKQGMIRYQFESEVMGPIKAFVSEYNAVSINQDDPIVVQANSQDNTGRNLGFFIGSRKFKCGISMQILDESDFLTVMDPRSSYRIQTRRREVPQLEGKNVVAWGMIKSMNGVGLNLILTESNSSQYGEWYLLRNEHSAISHRKDNRPDPFPFEYDEIKKELPLIKAVHIYQTQIKELKDDSLVQFIADLY